MDFKNKTALITGSGQGVGRGIALALSERGANIALVGRTLLKVESVANEIKDNGGSAIAIECDVKDKDSIKAAIDLTISEFSGINFLINNTQEVPLGNLLQVSDDAFEAGWMSGPLATFHFMKLCHPFLQGGGKIIKDNEKSYIEFYGSSSEEANEKHYGGLADYRSSEGKKVRIEYRSSLEKTVKDILGGIRSSCTYVGAPTLKQLSKCTTFVRVNNQYNDVFGRV